MHILLTRPILGMKIKDGYEYGKKIEVKNGYGKYLIRYHGALFANETNLNRVQKEKDVFEAKFKEKELKIIAIVEKINALGETTIMRNANDSGNLYGAISPKDISDMLKEHEIFVDSSCVVRSEISKIGEHIVELKIGNHDASFKLIINRIVEPE